MSTRSADPLELFEPGAHFTMPPSLVAAKAPTKVRTLDVRVRVVVPLRLYSYVHDLRGTRVRPMTTYAVTQAVDRTLATSLTVRATAGRSLESNGPIHGALRHMHQLFCHVTHTELGVYFEVDSLLDRHVGLGSSSAELLSFLVGLNRLCDSPLNWHQLREVLCWNFVERDLERPHLVVPAATVGCAFAAGMYGGLIALGPGYELVAAMPIPPEYRLVVYVPSSRLRNQRQGPPPTPYFQPFGSPLTENEALATAYRDGVFHNEILPAIRERNFSRYLRFMGDLLDTRLHAFEARYGPGYVEHLQMMRGHGALLPAQSSSGPAAFFYAHATEVDRLVDHLVSLRFCETPPIVGPASVGARVFVNETLETVPATLKEVDWC